MQKANGYAHLPPGFIKPSSQQIEQWRQEGKTFNRIAKYIGLGNNHGKTVWRWARAYGLPTKSLKSKLPPGVVKPDRKKLEKLSKKWVTYAAREIGVAHTTLRYWLKKEGLYHPRRKPHYNMPHHRQWVLETVMSKTRKKPPQLTVDDFQKTRDRNNEPYMQIINWYRQKNNCTRSRALYELIKEFYPKAAKIMENSNHRSKK